VIRTTVAVVSEQQVFNGGILTQFAGGNKRYFRPGWFDFLIAE